MAADHRRWRAYVRHFHGRGEHREGGDEGIRSGGDRAAGAEAQYLEAGEVRQEARGGAAGGRSGGEHGRDGTEGRGCICILAIARRQRTGGGGGQTGGGWAELADDRQPRRERVAGGGRLDLLHG